jgi:hypothetical protein
MSGDGALSVAVGLAAVAGAAEVGVGEAVAGAYTLVGGGSAALSPFEHPEITSSAIAANLPVERRSRCDTARSLRIAP